MAEATGKTDGQVPLSQKKSQESNEWRTPDQSPTPSFEMTDLNTVFRIEEIRFEYKPFITSYLRYTSAPIGQYDDMFHPFLVHLMVLVCHNILTVWN